jgi:hypothetical protein
MKIIYAFLMYLCVLCIPPITPVLAPLYRRIHFTVIKRHYLCSEVGVLWFLAHILKQLKAKFALVLNYKHHPMQTYERVEVWLHAFLDSALEECEWLASRPDLFPPVLTG